MREKLRLSLREIELEDPDLLATALWSIQKEFQLPLSFLSAVINVSEFEIYRLQRDKFVPDYNPEFLMAMQDLMLFQYDVQVAFPDPTIRANWFHTPHEICGDRSPIDFIMAGPEAPNRRLRSYTNSLGLILKR